MGPRKLANQVLELVTYHPQRAGSTSSSATSSPPPEPNPATLLLGAQPEVNAPTEKPGVCEYIKENIYCMTCLCACFILISIIVFCLQLFTKEHDECVKAAGYDADEDDLVASGDTKNCPDPFLLTLFSAPTIFAACVVFLCDFIFLLSIGLRAFYRCTGRQLPPNQRYTDSEDREAASQVAASAFCCLVFGTLPLQGVTNTLPNNDALSYFSNLFSVPAVLLVAGELSALLFVGVIGYRIYEKVKHCSENHNPAHRARTTPTLSV